MSTVSLRDVQVQNDGQSVRITGFSTFGFTSTEVRLNMGFNVNWKVSGRPVVYGLHRLVLNYHSQTTSIQWAMDAIIREAHIKVAARKYEEIHPEGRTSVEIPFEFVISLAEWLNFIDIKFGALPGPAMEIKESLRVSMEVDVSPNIYGGTAGCIIPPLDQLESDNDL